jgi:hypothetical protein
MENNDSLKKRDPVAIIVGLFIWGFVAIAALCGSGGLAVLAIKWFVSLIKGGL